MRLDCHIHSTIKDRDRTDVAEILNAAGFDGAVIMSHEPDSLKMFNNDGNAPPTPEERIDAVLKITNGHKYLFPFFWVDPTETGALKQVELAESKGIKGFKVICSRHFPCDERAMPVYKKIAELNRPILFHSGILWDGVNASGNYNRPCNFEGLFSIAKLRFALAHISWPWTDECIAVFGKLPPPRGDIAEMFVDITPGTPKIYRKPAFERLLLIYGKARTNVMFGSDTMVGGLSVKALKGRTDMDDPIYAELGVAEEFIRRIYRLNLLRFIGLPEDY